MASRTAYAGLANDGDVYTAANHARMPGGAIGYSLLTADAPAASLSDVEIASLTVTVGPSRLVRVRFEAPSLRLFNLGSGPIVAAAFVKLKADTVQVQRAELRGPTDSTASAALTIPLSMSAILAPSVGSRTYSVALFTGSTSIRLTAQSSSAQPSILTVEDLGPAF